MRAARAASEERMPAGATCPGDAQLLGEGVQVLGRSEKVRDQGKRIEALDEHVHGQARWCARAAVELGWWSRQMEPALSSARVPHVEQPV